MNVLMSEEDVEEATVKSGSLSNVKHGHYDYVLAIHVSTTTNVFHENGPL